MPPNTFGPNAQHIPWSRLPDIAGTDQKLVDGRLMDREEYDTCDYRIEGTYTTDDGVVVEIWRASLEGLQSYGRLCRERREYRIAVAQGRRESLDAWSAEVERMVEGAEHEPEH